MAVISEIRNRPWIMLLVVGLALLAFLIDPQTLSNFNLGGKDLVGEVDGQEIRTSEYENYKRLISSNYANNEQATENFIAQSAWNEILNDKSINRQLAKIGLIENPDSFWDFAAKQYGFTNKDATENISKFKETLAKWQKQEDKSSKQSWNLWLDRKDFINANLKRQNYLKLVSSGMLFTNNQVNQLINLEKDSIGLEYVKIDYAKVYEKEPFEISDNEVESYLKKHQKKYDKEATRELDYVIFRSNPSEKDINGVKSKVESFLTGYKELDPNSGEVIDDVPAFSASVNDSALVMNYSDSPIRWDYFSESELRQVFPSPIVNFAVSARIKQVSKPIRTNTIDGNDAFIIAKLNDKKSIIDSSLVSHIMISYLGSPIAENIQGIARSKEKAKAFADSIFSVVKTNPAKFGDLISLSDDKNILSTSKSKGQLPWLTRKATGLPRLVNFALNNKSGNLGLIETKIGYHIVKVDAVKTKMGYRIANITKYITPSDETKSSNYENANIFYEKVSGKTRTDFSKAANENNYVFGSSGNVELFNASIMGLRTEKDDDMLMWAFKKDTEKGDIKQFTTNKDDYIIAFLAGKNTKGLPSVSSVRNEITNILKKQKAVAFVNTEIKGKSLPEIATAFGTNITKTSSTFSYSSDQNINQSPSVLGAAFSLKNGGISDAIEENGGVFVIKTIERKTLNRELQTGELNYIKGQFKNKIVSSATNSLLPSLVKYLSPNDNRQNLLNF